MQGMTNIRRIDKKEETKVEPVKQTTTNESSSKESK